MTPGAVQCRLWPSWAHMEGRDSRRAARAFLFLFLSLGAQGQGSSPPGQPGAKAGTPGSLPCQRPTPPDCGPGRAVARLGPPDCPIAALPRELCHLEHVTSSPFTGFLVGQVEGRMLEELEVGSTAACGCSWPGPLAGMAAGARLCPPWVPETAAAPPPPWGGSKVLFAAEATVPGAAPALRNVC